MSPNMSRTLTLLIIGILVYLFARPIFWVGLAIIIFALIFGIYNFGKAAKIRDDIAKDPEAYFQNQQNKWKKDSIKAEDIIDAEFKEKEREEKVH